MNPAWKQRTHTASDKLEQIFNHSFQCPSRGIWVLPRSVSQNFTPFPWKGSKIEMRRQSHSPGLGLTGQEIQTWGEEVLFLAMFNSSAELSAAGSCWGWELKQGWNLNKVNLKGPGLVEQGQLNEMIFKVLPTQSIPGFYENASERYQKHSSHPQSRADWK